MYVYNVDMMVLLFSCTGCGVCSCTMPTLNGATSTNIRIKTRTFKEQTVYIVELKIYPIKLILFVNIKVL